MSTARFARSGRLRICILMSMFLVLIMMIVIYHMSQHQLDESRAFQVRCEQNQEGLNEQLQSLTEQKFASEKKLDIMRVEKVSMQQNFETRLAETVHKHQETLRALSEKYEAQLGKYKQLEVKYNELEADCVKSKKHHLEDTNAFEQKLQNLLAELQKDKTAKERDVTIWKEKYDTLLRDSERKTHSLEATLTEFKSHCDYVPKVQPAEAPQQQQLNKPSAHTSETTRQSSPAQMVHSIEKPRNQKSFDVQQQVSEGLYRIGAVVNLLATKPNVANATITAINKLPTNSIVVSQLKSTNLNAVEHISHAAPPQQQEQPPLLTFAVRNNHSLILNSVENFQIVPKSIKTSADETETQLKQQQEEPVAGAAAVVSPLSKPRKPSSTASSAPAAVKQAGEAPSPANASVASKPSSSSLPPLAMPPPKKLPENVAPIPDNFEDKVGNKEDPADLDTAAEELPKNENKNNRYANAVNDLEQSKVLGVAPKPNEDSDAHEVKEFMNEQNLNLPAENHFFDGDLPVHEANGAADETANKQLAVQEADAGEDDDDLMGNVADVAVKQPQHLLDDNLNNEIAGDQGKEFAEGLHLDDGLEEDQDEDDYSHQGVRKPGAEVVRN